MAIGRPLNLTANVASKNISVLSTAGQTSFTVAGGYRIGTQGAFTADVSIADKIIHTGDTNTAIRFPSADTITAETGGSERLRIASDGLVTLGGAQFNSNVTPGSGSGVEIFAPSSEVGTIQAFDRTNNEWDTLRIKGTQLLRQH